MSKLRKDTLRAGRKDSTRFPVDLYERTIRRTRFSRVCTRCKRIIVKGERYTCQWNYQDMPECYPPCNSLYPLKDP